MQNVNQQNKQGTQDRLSDIIAKAASKGKFLDFRNNLVPAADDDYAMVHGIGGQKHAARSTIKLMITDYTNANKSKVVTANVSPEQIAYMLTICEKNAELLAGADLPDCQEASELVAQMQRETVLPADSPVNPCAEPVLAVPGELFERLFQMKLPKEAVPVAAAMQPFPLPPNGGPAYVGVSRRLVSLLGQTLCGGACHGVSYSYSQERVNSYRQENGLCPVCTLSITRTGVRKDGSVSTMPWSVTIKNFFAQPNRQKNGMTSYNSKTSQNQTEAFALVSDADMYRCLYRTVRFIELWEIVNGIPLVRQGLERKADRRRRAAENGLVYAQN